jgi:hypothetical protein
MFPIRTNHGSSFSVDSHTGVDLFPLQGFSTKRKIKQKGDNQ